MTSTPQAVIFDLDGTLLDTWAVHLACLRTAVAEVGAVETTAARMRASQRPTDLGTLVELVGIDRAEAALGSYHDALDSSVEDAAPAAMPYAREVVDRLRAAGLAMGVCTGRSWRGARTLLAASGLDLPLLTARSSETPSKPAPDALWAAMAALGVTAGRALFVGDTVADAWQGRAAGVSTVIVGPTPPGVRVPTIGSLAELPRACGVS